MKEEENKKQAKRVSSNNHSANRSPINLRSKQSPMLDKYGLAGENTPQVTRSKRSNLRKFSVAAPDASVDHDDPYETEVSARRRVGFAQ